MRYAARVTRHGSGRVTVHVPGVPGAIVFGDTETDATERAQRLVLLLVRQLMIDGLPVPSPRAPGDVWVDIPAEDAAAIGRYSAGQVGAHDRLRSLLSALATTRKRGPDEPAA